jgi:trimethylamine--corrinoid protein Co-methyltransferase
VARTPDPGKRARSTDIEGLVSLPLREPFELLSSDDVRKIHEATLTALERTGMHVGSERVLSALSDEGARVDMDSKRAWFPPELVEAKMALAPSSFTLAARDPGYDLPLDGRLSYLSTEGCLAEIVDVDTGEWRPSTKDDLEQMTRLGDALPEIAFQWQPVSANDVPAAVRPMHEVHAQLPNTSKHIQQMTAIDPLMAHAAVDMAAAVAGSPEELRRRPIMSNFQCSISPFAWHEGPIEAMLVFAEAGVPVGACSMPLAAATGPTTTPGNIILANSEILAGLTIVQTFFPGAPVFYVSFATTMDMNSGALNLGWGPEDLFCELASGQMGRFYDIPSSAGIFCTGSKSQDWHAGAQNALSGFAKAVSSAQMLNAAGSLCGSRVFSAESLMLDCEIFNLLARMNDGYVFDEESMALDVIDQVGPEGHFLASPHTLAHMRDPWRAKFFNRQAVEDWAADGRPAPQEVALAEARRILEEYEPTPLPGGVDEQLLEIVHRYEHLAEEVA